MQLYRSNYTLSTATVNGSNAAIIGGGKTVGRWLKERKERRKEENRVQNAQLHAAVSVAGVAAAIAAIASASASSQGGNDGKDIPKTDMALASAATLVAAQCVEAAEAMGAEHDHLASVISSAVNVKSAGDIMTLTAAASTGCSSSLIHILISLKNNTRVVNFVALKGAATLKSRAMKEVWNAAAINPTETGIGASSSYGTLNILETQKFSGDPHPIQHDLDLLRDCESNHQIQHEDNFVTVRLLADGCELLKRTRSGKFTFSQFIKFLIN